MYFRQQFAQMSHRQPNRLIKNIEFYKIQHRTYPENLKELEKDDNLAPTVDPIQLHQQRQNKYFNY